MTNLWHYLLAAGLFVAIDSIWLTTMSKRFYRKQIGSLLAAKPNFVAAAIFYAIYILGIVVFVLNPALEKDSLSFAIGGGALLGLTMYATYDLTNQATLKKWPTILTVVDLAWGTFITSLVSTLAFLILK
jgi:uncharacterized membrane protein